MVAFYVRQYGLDTRAGSIYVGIGLLCLDIVYLWYPDYKAVVKRVIGSECYRKRTLEVKCAVKLISDLKEVWILTQVISRHEGARPIIFAESESEPEHEARPGTEVAACRIYFGEERRDEKLRLMTFSIDPYSEEIFVYNRQSERIPLEEWRKGEREINP